MYTSTTNKRGQKHGIRKASIEQFKRITELREDHNKSYGLIASELNISRQAVQQMVARYNRALTITAGYNSL